MKHKFSWFLSCLFVLGMASLVRADDPTSRFFPLSPLASSLSPSSTGTAVQFEVWDSATGGTMIFAEPHTVDTDAGSNITNDTGLSDLLLGRGTAGGLAPGKFPTGSTRYLDVTQSGATVLTARLPLYASIFSVSAASEVPGNLNIVDSTGDAGNILKGGALFLHNFGTDNTFLGKNAGNLNTFGAGRNTAIGGGALNSNTTGSYNTASGFGALAFNTTGSFNTADGENALLSNTTGNNNTAAGAIALYRNTTGAFNTATGLGALQNNTTGSYNTASGVQALYSNCPSPCSGDEGSFNTANGVIALYSNTTGAANTAIGYRALQANTIGSNNTATGYQALAANTTGAFNTATGLGALQNNTTGSYNTASGFQALYSNCSSPCTVGQGSYNTASGYDALRNNTTGTDNTASGWGALGNNNTGGANTATGQGALPANTTGDGNTATGERALQNNITGSFNTAIGMDANVSADNLHNATAIGYAAIVDASSKIRLGNNGVTVIEGQVPYTFTSDKNQKENFQPVNAEDVLTKLAHLPVSTWNYIGHDPKQFRHYGPVAQDFFAAFGHDGVGTIGTDTTINSGDMEGILMIAVQALEKRTSELATLKAENTDLKARLEKLERSIGTLMVKAE